jgi:hypothetical protein
LLAHSYSRALLICPIVAAAFWISSCAAPLGPGYTIESQEIQVHLDSVAPRIRIASVYRLRNSGNQPVSSLEVRLPARRAFRVESAQAAWDDAPLSLRVSAENPRDTLLELAAPWKISARHTLRLSTDIVPPASGETAFSFASDAFFLPSEGWAPELLPARGLFSTGGVPPKNWRFSVEVPAGFLVHASGRSPKISRHGGEISVESLQSSEDRYPFVVAGRYVETPFASGSEKIKLWTRANVNAGGLRSSGDALARAVQAFDTTFGTRAETSQQLWIVECPVVAGCFSAARSSYASLLNPEPAAVSSQLASVDTVMMDISGGASNFSAAAPALAATWLGYGQNPGFYEQEMPLAALPAFAASLAETAAAGPEARVETIRRGLLQIPQIPANGKSPDEATLRAKSFLFFYALQDQYGEDVFRRAVTHMLSARHGRGFNLSDLISAFEQETQQNVAEFVRSWMKHPGVPADFRARYQNTSSAFEFTSKETVP